MYWVHHNDQGMHFSVAYSSILTFCHERITRDYMSNRRRWVIYRQKRSSIIYTRYHILESHWNLSI